MAAALALALALGVGLVGCGSEEGDDAAAPAPATTASSPATDPGSSPTASDTPSDPASGADPGGGTGDAVLLSASAAGGRVDPEPTVLGDPDDVAQLVAGLTDGRLRADVAAAVAAAAPAAGEVVVGAVVAIGCEPPTDVVLRRTADGVEVLPVRADKPDVQCRVPVTTVAVLTVPRAVL